MQHFVPNTFIIAHGNASRMNSMCGNIKTYEFNTEMHTQAICIIEYFCKYNGRYSLSVIRHMWCMLSESFNTYKVLSL